MAERVFPIQVYVSFQISFHFFPNLLVRACKVIREDEKTEDNELLIKKSPIIYLEESKVLVKFI